MEKIKADIEAQTAVVVAADEHRTNCRQEAARLREQARKIIKDATAKVRAEKLKLREYSWQSTLLKSADAFGTDLKVLFAGPKMAIKNYMAHNSDGLQVRFAVKRIAYPLELKDGTFVGLAKPREGVHVQTLKSGRTANFKRSPILETDVYNLLSKQTITKTSDKEAFPYSPTDVGERNINFKNTPFYGTLVAIGTAATYKYNVYPHVIDKPAVITSGYLVFNVAYRTDLSRKKAAAT